MVALNQKKKDSPGFHGYHCVTLINKEGGGFHQNGRITLSQILAFLRQILILKLVTQKLNQSCGVLEP